MDVATYFELKCLSFDLPTLMCATRISNIPQDAALIAWLILLMFLILKFLMF